MKFPSNLNELINSGITLTNKEAQLVEEYIFSIQEKVSPYQLNSSRGRAVIGLGSPFK